MRQFLSLLFFTYCVSTTAISQTFYVQARTDIKQIDSLTKMMDEGAHAIHLQVSTNSKNQLTAGAEILLSKAIKALEWHTKSHTRYEIKYIIELKKSAKYQIESKAVHDLLDSYIALRRVIIQSEDFKILKYWKKNYPDMKIAAFIDNQKSIDTNLANLGFKPTIYCPDYKFLSEQKVSNLHTRSIQVIPWTVNDTTIMQQLIKWNVDGIITNSPDQSKLIGINKEVKNGK